jgi:hypothetical protein
MCVLLLCAGRFLLVQLSADAPQPANALPDARIRKTDQLNCAEPEREQASPTV